MTADRFDIIYLPETDSTNLQASALLSEKRDKKPFVIRTDFQTAGRGQSKNTWVSEKGNNLLCSVAVFPGFLDVSNHFYLSKMAALSLHDTLKSFLSKTEIKWPNDILVNERKIAGILIENILQGQKLTGSILGIGLNINQQSFPPFSPEASSILIETGLAIPVEEVFEKWLEQFDYWYGVLEEKRWQTIDSHYLEAMYRFDRFAMYKIPGHEFRARIVGVETDGYLMLETENKELLRFGFKEVSFVS